MIVDCKECQMYRSTHCGDCFVMAVLTRPQDEPLEIEVSQEPAITRLQEAGLAPRLRFKRKAG